MADPTTPGKKTSEWMVVVGSVLAAIAAPGAAFLANLDQGSLLYVIVGSLLALATVFSTYIAGRSKVKAARALPLPPPPAP